MSTNFRSFAKIDGANDVVILVLVHNLWPIWLHFLMGLLFVYNVDRARAANQVDWCCVQKPTEKKIDDDALIFPN